MLFLKRSSIVVFIVLLIILIGLGAAYPRNENLKIPLIVIGVVEGLLLFAIIGMRPSYHPSANAKIMFPNLYTKK
jgi:hypothetical protein